MSEKKGGKPAAEVLDKQLGLPFDQYQRYRIVADVVERLRESPDPLRVLDVGDGESVISNFLPQDLVTVLNQPDAEGLPGFVNGEATALPFEDEAFDYVVSVDVYEHIEPEARDKYLSELRRTARKGVLLAAPFDSAVVREAEQAVNEFNRAVNLVDSVRLREPAENGLPKLDEVRRFFKRHEDTVSVLPNGYIPHWLAMMCLTFYSPKLEGELRSVFDRVNAFYNEFIYALDNAEPCYRYLLVSSKAPVNADLDELMSSDPAPGRTLQSYALFGQLSAILPLAIEIKQLNTRLERQLATETQQLNARLALYERQLAQKEGALARKEATINDLAGRLAEHIGTINSLERGPTDLRQPHSISQRSSADLEKQNANLKRQKDQLQQQLDGVTNSRGWRLLTAVHNLRQRIVRTSRSG